MIAKLKRLWEHWLRIAKVIGDFQAGVILTVFYIVIFGPMAIFFRLLSDALRLKKPDVVTWSSRPPTDQKLEAARRQF
jgi:hypothetical protein